MWKESYRIGIEVIDKQHMELFRMTNDLLKAIETKAGKEEYKKAIAFLKDYVVIHFRDEEEYQKSIQYKDIEAHKKMHRDFTMTVLDYEKKLIEADFDIHILKDLAGTLTAWLIYHVADTDQKLAKEEVNKIHTETTNCLDIFASNVSEVLEKMAGLDSSQIQKRKISNHMEGDVFVQIGLVGDKEGKAVFAFSKELAFQLIETMTFCKPDTVDELVCSALAEISNISSGNAATELSEKGILCDIKPPLISIEHSSAQTQLENISLHTELGSLGIAVSLK